MIIVSCEKILNLLRKEFEIKETTQLKSYLGMKIESDKNGIYLNQTKYIEKLLHQYEMSDCKPEQTNCNGRRQSKQSGWRKI